MYTMLADLVHHVRGHLSYNLLCWLVFCCFRLLSLFSSFFNHCQNLNFFSSVYAFTKSMFDPAIQPTVQSMCIKLMMNLIESFVVTEKNHPDQPASSRNS